MNNFFQEFDAIAQLHSSCIDTKPGEFFIKEFDEDFWADDAIQWGLDNGYRPGMHTELPQCVSMGKTLVALGTYKQYPNSVKSSMDLLFGGDPITYGFGPVILDKKIYKGWKVLFVKK